MSEKKVPDSKHPHPHDYQFSEFDDSYGNMPGSQGGLTREYAPPSNDKSIFNEGPPNTSGHRGKGPQYYQREDRWIIDKICEDLHYSDEIDATDLIVIVESGVTTLSGIVADESMKRAAETLVRSIYGVKSVSNCIEIAHPEAKAS